MDPGARPQRQEAKPRSRGDQSVKMQHELTRAQLLLPGALSLHDPLIHENNSSDSPSGHGPRWKRRQPGRGPVPAWRVANDVPPWVVPPTGRLFERFASAQAQARGLKGRRAGCHPGAGRNRRSEPGHQGWSLTASTLRMPARRCFWPLRPPFYRPQGGIWMSRHHGPPVRSPRGDLPCPATRAPCGRKPLSLTRWQIARFPGRFPAGGAPLGGVRQL